MEVVSVEATNISVLVIEIGVSLISPSCHISEAAHSLWKTPEGCEERLSFCPIAALNVSIKRAGIVPLSLCFAVEYVWLGPATGMIIYAYIVKNKDKT